MCRHRGYQKTLKRAYGKIFGHLVYPLFSCIPFALILGLQ